MPLEFPALLRGTYPESVPVVESTFTADELADRLVVWNEVTRKYLVFSGRDEFFAWQAALAPEARCFHEVVFGGQPQRLKFDIDAPAAKLAALPPNWARGPDIGEAAPAPAPAPAQTELPPDLAELLGLDAEDLAAAAPCPDSDSPAAAARAVSLILLDLLAEAILDELYETYSGLDAIRPTREDLVVTDSSGPTADGWKESFHVLVHPFGVADNEEAREFSDRVRARLPPAARKLVDGGVNKRIQNFRVAGSAKAGTRRVKRLDPELSRRLGTAEHLGEADLLVRLPPGARVLTRVCDGPGAGDPGAAEAPSLERESPAVRDALALAAGQGVTDGHVLESVHGSLLCFRRRPGAAPFCRIHGEAHHRDNFLMLGVHPAAGTGAGPVACQVVEYCRQARGEGRPLGEIRVPPAALRGLERPAARARARAAKAPRPPAETVSAIAERLAELRAGADPHAAAASAFEGLPADRQTVYAAPEMRPFELVPTLAVRAQMKLGKTKALGRFLSAHYPSGGLVPRTVRFVTFRQTFSRSLAEAFPDFTHYSDVVGDLDPVRHPRLIVQVESLHRLRFHPEPVDLLVLDEVESILEQFSSGLHRNFNAAFAMFQLMLRTARRVVCMDANLGDRTFRTLARMRPDHPAHFHWNREARAAGDRYLLTADQGAWLERLYAALRAGQRVVLPTNSLGEARAFEEALRREFPAKAVRLYSSETAPSEKARHFADVHTHWGGLDVLIFTPTCSAGVSFELPWFDAVFAFFCDASCGVETCRQMLGRVRQIATRDHFVCLRATGASLPATPEALRRLLYDKRAGLFRAEGCGLQFEYEPETGDIAFYESDFFHLWLENTCVANLSRNDFVRRFIDQVADSGARLEPLAGVAPAAGAALLLGHRDLRDELKAARCEAVAAAEDITPEEAAATREAISAQLDVEPARRLALEKFFLREAYAWHGRPLDAAFVDAYQGAAARRVYRNLCRITAAPSVPAALERIRQREAEHYTYSMGARAEAAVVYSATESRDLIRDRALFVHQAHALANWLLGVCGLRLGGRERVHADQLEARLRGAIDPLGRAFDRLVFELEIPRANFAALAAGDPARFLPQALRSVNAALRAMYGVQVQRTPRRAGVGGDAYFLAWAPIGRLFVLSAEPEPDDTPGGPRPHIPSQLAVDGDAAEEAGRVALFLESVFYADGRAEPAGADPARAEPEPAEPEPSGLTDDDVDALLAGLDPAE